MHFKKEIGVFKEKIRKTIVKYKTKNVGKCLSGFIGAVAIVAGSEILVKSACEIAEKLHISEEIISVTIVAMGTSLPEFVTTVTAIIKKESSLSVGNIVGANMIDSSCMYITRRKKSPCFYADGID